MLAEPDLWLLGTAGIVSATVGAFSIIVYTFWYDKMSGRWDKMIQDIRARDLGGQMKAQGAKELDLWVAARIFRLRRKVNIEEGRSDLEDFVTDVSPILPPGTTIGFDKSHIETRRITTAAFELGGKIRRVARSLLYSILALSAGVSFSSLLAFTSVSDSSYYWERGVLAGALALWLLLLAFVAIFIVEPYPFWEYHWIDQDRKTIHFNSSVWQD